MTALGGVWQPLSILETRTILQAIAGLMQGRSGEKGGEGRETNNGLAVYGTGTTRMVLV